MFGPIGTIIVGFIVGVIAKLIMPGKENMGMIMTPVLGIVGALAATAPNKRLVGIKPERARAGWVRSSVRSSCCGVI